MPRRVSFDDHPDLERIAAHHAILEDAIHLYYSSSNPRFAALFEFDTPEEVRCKRDFTLYETGAASAMTLLASIEASFRVDYLQRHYAKKKDPLSRAFQSLYREKQQNVSLLDDILDAWKTHSDIRPGLISDIRSAFRYRHWLAHGRYWVPKLGRSYDFETIYDLACTVELAFPFLRLRSAAPTVLVRSQPWQPC